MHHLLVGGLEHFFHILGRIWYVILPVDFHSYFSRWLKHVKTTKQIGVFAPFVDPGWIPMPRPSEDTRGPKGSLGGEEPNPFNPTRWGSTFCAANAAWIIHENMVKTWWIMWTSWRFHDASYCGWKKSCTTWDGRKPINNGINHLLTCAGFLPSTSSRFHLRLYTS